MALAAFTRRLPAGRDKVAAVGAFWDPPVSQWTRDRMPRHESDSESDALAPLASDLVSPLAPEPRCLNGVCLTMLVGNVEGTTRDVMVHVATGSAKTREASSPVIVRCWWRRLGVGFH